jgi:hypothetical protein
MRLVLAILMMALMAVPAFARGKHQSAAQSQLSAEQLKKAQEADQDYKTSLDRIPDQKAADRWGNAR